MNTRKEKISLRDLKKKAKELGINPLGMSRETVLFEMNKKGKDNQHTDICKLGMRGKEGLVTEVKIRGKTYAKKQFKLNKSPRELEREVRLQRIAAAGGVSPNILEFNLHSKYILMEKLSKNLFEILTQKNGKMTKKLQKEILKIFKRLDRIGIFHKDPNPLNFMLDNDGNLFIIDFGFAQEIDPKKHGKSPNQNQMTLGLLIKFQKFFPSQDYSILKSALPSHLQSILEMKR